MRKKYYICFIVFVFLFYFPACTNNDHFESIENDGDIYVSLVVPEMKGSIDVTHYQIVEAVITITAPDTTQEIQTWIIGDDFTLVYQNKGTGIYNISVLERDEINNEFTYNTDFNVTDGYNTYLTIHLGGNIIVDIDNDDIPTFTETQEILTSGALCWESINIGSEKYLVAANSYDDSTYNNNSIIYKWDGIQFIEYQIIPTYGASDLKSFIIDSETYLAVANYRNNSAQNIDSVIYKWDGNQFIEYQVIPTSGAIDWEVFSINMQLYIAVANNYNGSTHNIHSVIYELTW